MWIIRVNWPTRRIPFYIQRSLLNIPQKQSRCKFPNKAFVGFMNDSLKCKAGIEIKNSLEKPLFFQLIQAYQLPWVFPFLEAKTRLQGRPRLKSPEIAFFPYRINCNSFVRRTDREIDQFLTFLVETSKEFL